jgi:hypothetical protein
MLRILIRRTAQSKYTAFVTIILKGTETRADGRLLCIGANVCARANAQAPGACVVVLDVTTVIFPRITKTAMCETPERGWYVVQRSRSAGSPGTD